MTPHRGQQGVRVERLQEGADAGVERRFERSAGNAKNREVRVTPTRAADNFIAGRAWQPMIYDEKVGTRSFQQRKCFIGIRCGSYLIPGFGQRTFQDARDVWLVIHDDYTGSFLGAWGHQ